MAERDDGADSRSATDPVTDEPRPLHSIRIFAPGSEVGARYEIRRVLGSGGYAVVYLAHDRELRRDIALKVLRADRMGDTALRRLRREAAVARDASSPRLVRIYDVGASEQAVFLTMEVVDGESLRDRLADPKRGRLPIEEVVRVGREILLALSVLHALRIVHRDVKPGNVLLAPDGTVKLADFGLARELARNETRATATEALVGTVDYVSPEQALGEDVDARSDLYSAGVVLFEMLAGTLPYQGKSTLGTLLQHVRAEVPDVRRLRPETPAWLARVVARLLEKQPSRRFASAAEVLAEFDRAGRGWRDRLAAVRPRRPLRAAAWALLAALFVTAAVAGWRWRAAERHRFARLSTTGTTQAIARDGTTLWKLPELASPDQVTVARLRPEEPLAVVGVLAPWEDFGDPALSTLSILDPETGALRRTVKLPSAAPMFQSFARRYSATVTAVDLDGDGWDEIVAHYFHAYWPSYVVVWEPRIERARIAFVAVGHHRFAAAVDLDGDGRRELVLRGLANRMGWYSSVAAVRLQPPINDVTTHQEIAIPGTPDGASYAPDGLVWFTLGRRGYFDTAPPRVDLAHRRISLSYVDGGTLDLGFDGFAANSGRGIAPVARADARTRAWASLREGSRLLDGGWPGPALVPLEDAARAAEAADMPTAREWIRRQVARALVAGGRREEGERLFSDLAAHSAAASDIAYDAGAALHAAGELERAVTWYERGLGPGATNDGGRLKYEFLEGAVLAFAELHREPEGVVLCRRFEAAFPMEHYLALGYQRFLRWHAGEDPGAEKPRFSTGITELIPYWELEIALAQGERPADLLPRVDKELATASETTAELRSLRGELLRRLGRFEEAERETRAAVEAMRAEKPMRAATRVHVGLAEERWGRARAEVALEVQRRHGGRAAAGVSGAR